MASLSDIIVNTTRKTGLPKKQVAITIETFLEEILLGLAKNSKVKISRFGSFELRKRLNGGNSPGYIKFKQSRLAQKLFRLIIGRKKDGRKNECAG